VHGIRDPVAGKAKRRASWCADFRHGSGRWLTGSWIPNTVAGHHCTAEPDAGTRFLSSTHGLPQRRAAKDARAFMHRAGGMRRQAGAVAVLAAVALAMTAGSRSTVATTRNGGNSSGAATSD